MIFGYLYKLFTKLQYLAAFTIIFFLQVCRPLNYQHMISNCNLRKTEQGYEWEAVKISFPHFVFKYWAMPSHPLQVSVFVCRLFCLKAKVSLPPCTEWGTHSSMCVPLIYPLCLSVPEQLIVSLHSFVSLPTLVFSCPSSRTEQSRVLEGVASVASETPLQLASSSHPAPAGH